jgi:mitochondrial fission protein ELM1
VLLEAAVTSFPFYILWEEKTKLDKHKNFIVHSLYAMNMTNKPRFVTGSTV